MGRLGGHICRVMVCPPCIPPTHTYNFESVPYRPVARVATVTIVAKIAIVPVATVAMANIAMVLVTTEDSITNYLCTAMVGVKADS